MGLAATSAAAASGGETESEAPLTSTPGSDHSNYASRDKSLARFDGEAAWAYVIMRDADAAVAFLSEARAHPVGAWGSRTLPSDAASLSPMQTAVLGLVETLVALELPQLASAMRRAGLPIALPAARWLHAGWLGVLRWEARSAALLLPWLLGVDFQAYLCVAALRRAAPPLLGGACAHPAELQLHLLLHHPLDGFDVLAALPFMLGLRERHGTMCLNTLASSGRAHTHRGSTANDPS